MCFFGGGFLFLNGRQDSPPAKSLRLTLLQSLLHYGGLEPNPRCLRGLPELTLPSEPCLEGAPNTYSDPVLKVIERLILFL